MSPRRLIALLGALLALPALAAIASAGTGGTGSGGSGGETTTSGAGHHFPVAAKHTYGDGFGAGRGHRGQDVFARCGKPLVAARTGKIKYRDFDRGGAGHYIVIDGKRTNRDYMYAHLKRRSKLRVGQRVRKGRLIGRVGDSGNASGCHLHFELWRGDWNGRPDVTRKLKRWDRLTSSR